MHEVSYGVAGSVAADASDRFLLLLPAVAEPDADGFLLEVQRLSHAGDLLGGRLVFLVKLHLQELSGGFVNVGPLLAWLGVEVGNDAGGQ